MSKCCGNNETKYFQTANNAGICDICHPCEVSKQVKAGLCPPLGEPKLLTLMAPVVFDEVGLNLCRVISADQLSNVCENPTSRTTDILFDGLTAEDLENSEHLQLQVVDVDFNFVCPKSCRYSEMRPAKNTPNLTRVILRDIDVTLAVKVLDPNCRVCKEGMMTLRYLPSENCPGYDEDTNPSNVAFDLYTPYGVAFAPENPAGCNKLVPTINCLGYVSNQHCQNCECDDRFGQPMFREFEANNGLQQGISAQGLAKVIASDEECFAIGLTLYFKVVYFVQYKVKHEGICVPPKISAVGNTESSSCIEFCHGDLLEQTIKPLNTCVEPKTLKDNCGCSLSSVLGLNNNCKCKC
ncbi:MAG: hypothetical protein RR324_04455 [Cellulosilyticaceae bacterium]